MLEDYKKKRDFSITPEPPAHAPRGSGELRFVIQKHAARRLHYDFRLEIDGVLVSWAVPKGPSLDPSEKHLAVQTEDHPIDYQNFEGIIPAREYGGGPVIIWDQGVFAPDDHGDTTWGDRETAQTRLREGLKKGKISIFLKGKKLHGSWTLFRLKNKERDWILMKHKDEFMSSTRAVVKEDRSVVSGRTIEEIRAGKAASTPVIAIDTVAGVKQGRMPSEISPMLSALTDEPVDAEGWIHEPKLDGIRAIAAIKNGRVSLTSRNGLDLTLAYPDIVKDLESYDADIIFDGEVVALDEKGRPSFQALQQRSGLRRGSDVKNAQGRTPVFYYVFDILFLDNKLLTGVKLVERKELLKQHLVPTDKVRFVEPLATDGTTAYKVCLNLGLEGLVSKRLDSVYEFGRRSKFWLKVKPTLSSEFVVCGFTEGTGARRNTFGALILGMFVKDKLVYVGGVGTGFNDKSLAALKSELARRETKKMPFAKKPLGKQIHWVEPELVAEVKFAEWTRDSMLRAPVFMRLRDDKTPQECTSDEVIREVEMQESTKMVEKPEPKAVRAEVVDIESKRSKSVSVPKSKVNESVLAQLGTTSNKANVDVDGHVIAFSNLDKELWPGTDKHPPLTKRDYAIYLTKIAPWLLNHTSDRPLTLLRYPNGINGQKFYQKHWEKNLPEFVQTVWLYGEHAGGDQRYLTCNNLPTLLWLAQIADLELHTWQARISPGPDGRELPLTFAGSVQQLEESLLNFPDYLLFDLDPYIYKGDEKTGEEPALNLKAFKTTCKLAKWIKEVLDALGIESFIKTTGKTGLHMYVPIAREFTFDEVRAISDTIGRAVLGQHPNDVTMDWAVVKRTGKIFLDHNMNARGKTLASIYSPRVSPEAAVSIPIKWDQIDDIYPTDFTMHSVPELLVRQGDLWSDILDHKNDLRAVMQQHQVKPPAKPSKRRKTS